MKSFEERVRCHTACKAYNGMCFYVGEEYYADSGYVDEVYYEFFDLSGRHIAYESVEFFDDYFDKVPDDLELVDMMFNNIMNDRIQ